MAGEIHCFYIHERKQRSFLRLQTCQRFKIPYFSAITFDVKKKLDIAVQIEKSVHIYWRISYNKAKTSNFIVLLYILMLLQICKKKLYEQVGQWNFMKSK